jgi:hypothetical protein
MSVWCNKFEDGQTAMNDGSETFKGRPRTSHHDEHCGIVEGLIREDRRIKVREMHCKKVVFCSLGRFSVS